MPRLTKAEKEMGARVAKLHHDTMLKEYPAEILTSYRNSRVYGYPNKSPNSITEFGDPVQTVIQTDSVSALFKASGKICVLNFADYVKPGGRYMLGDCAQEEFLCSESTLYEVLSRFQKYYEWNEQNKNHALYMDRAIYSPDIVFHRGDTGVVADVLSVAAPRWKVAGRYKMATEEDNVNALKSRFRFISEILAEHNVETFIGGAWGCGVFGQDPEMIAMLFKTTKWGSSLKRIIHPIPGGANLYDFQEVFQG